ncbi:hypothetical protein [Pedobacter sp. N23S346]|uniref:hypothetical protein n=1 Tax=Pedobacter sp. N23S346 TaxID=3402750 RepID=UPI003AD2E991
MNLNVFYPKQLLSFLILSILFLSSCSETPEKFFDTTILNTNTIKDFASPDLAHRIEAEAKEYPNIPSSKKKGDEAVTNVKMNTMFLEQSLDKIKKLSASGDEQKELQKLSIDLYEYVIPVYKNEYLAYAKLCDAQGDQNAKDEIIKNIDSKYGATFEQKHDALMEKGKAYAQEHNIQVSWGE